MGLDDIIADAKQQLGEHSDQVDSAIDKAAEVIKDKTPDQADGAIDGTAAKAKEIL
jgi:hypothetical protein